jgi:transposase
MGAAIEIDTDLSLEELENAYRHATTGISQRRAHVILLRARGVAPFEVARLLCLTPRTISTYVHRFNEKGLNSFLDARAHNVGRAPLLNERGRDLLQQALESPPEDGGRWSGPKVTRWLETYVQREPHSIDNSKGWALLKSLGYSYKSSRPQHVKSASDEEREQWKKNSTSE